MWFRREASLGAGFNISPVLTLGLACEESWTMVLVLCILTQWTTQGLGPTLETKSPTERRTLGKAGKRERWALPDFWRWSFSLIGMASWMPAIIILLPILGEKVIEGELFSILQGNGIFHIHGPKPEDMKRWRVSHFFFSVASRIDALHIYWIFTYLVLFSEDTQSGWEEKYWWLELENKLDSRHKRFEGRISGPLCDDISIPVGRVAKLLLFKK